MNQIFKLLKKFYPNAKIALNYKTPIDLLVATILSAQCTDKRVNIVTEALFKKYKTAKDYADASAKDFEQEIRSTGFFRNKAKSIINSAKIIVEKYHGKVPDSMEELIKFPGVARKTASVVLYNAFNKIEGITVDTHVIRLSQRLGLSKNKNPEKIEQDLMKIIPKPMWGDAAYLLIEHGRNICKAKKPLCPQCGLKNICPFYDSFMNKFYNGTVA
ncbi:MAG: endonuclease III [Candidatus Saganbacteria bacterium]|uniref:Endonuclease III n=1 Tax=Candidatus Saganbacteria bacterium TaxID=2575572 RepID=A0A833P060_UNCSA|nr:MAG: endonuclease III [Candidatus Saganbacteria bacterium]